MAAKRTPNKEAIPQVGPESVPYQVLARRYRSRTFTELVGQESIARTLQNAIDLKRTAHAYLFCGTRGVGKTSTARIFAAALNAVDTLSERDAIKAAIMRGDDIDVIEIDGASNRGVDDARDLISGAGLAPSRSPYKIYIIDEVHMLTQPAFNALLKTMEEPPAHVKFILCTTEAHKVPATIQSRCQRFDFRNIGTVAIAGHLREVLQGESIEADDSVVLQVARLANGSMRDGLSLLERLIAGARGRIDAAMAREVLGLPDEEALSGVIAAIAKSDPHAGLMAVGALIDNGMACDHALEVLAARIRDAMVCRTCGSAAGLVDLSAEVVSTLTAQVAHLAPEDLAHMVALCDASARNARGSAISRTLLDATVVRLCLHETFASAASLLHSSAVLPEQKKKPELVGGAPAPVRAPAPAPVRAPAPAPVRAPAPAPVRAPAPAPVRAPAPQPSVSPGEPSSAKVPSREVLSAHPLVREVMEVFDASWLRAAPASNHPSAALPSPPPSSPKSESGHE